MSWQTFVDGELVGKSEGHCDQAAIIGEANGQWSVWAATPGFNITPEETTAIGRAMASGADGMTSYFAANGVRLAGVKYQFLRTMDDNVVLAKCKGNGNLSMQKMKTAIAIAHTKEGGQAGNVNKVLEKLCEYLGGLGY